MISNEVCQKKDVVCRMSSPREGKLQRSDVFAFLKALFVVGTSSSNLCVSWDFVLALDSKKKNERFRRESCEIDPNWGVVRAKFTRSRAGG